MTVASCLLHRTPGEDSLHEINVGASLGRRICFFAVEVNSGCSALSTTCVVPASPT